MGVNAIEWQWPSFQLPSTLWITAILFFGIGDLVTTMVGLSVGASEANPFVALLIEQYGIGILVPMKTLLLVGCYGIARWTFPVPPTMVPFVLTVMGIIATVWNVFVLIVVSFPLS